MFKSETRSTRRQPVDSICLRVRTKPSKGKTGKTKPVDVPPPSHSNAHVTGAHRGVGVNCLLVNIYNKKIYIKQRLTNTKPVDKSCLRVSTSTTGYFQCEQTAGNAFLGAVMKKAAVVALMPANGCCFASRCAVGGK